jgi:hypothetical protein
MTGILPERPDATDVIDQAYALRSALIHDGRPADLDVDLGRGTATVSELLREIYARLLGRRLLKSIAVQHRLETAANPMPSRHG